MGRTKVGAGVLTCPVWGDAIAIDFSLPHINAIRAESYYRACYCSIAGARGTRRGGKQERSWNAERSVARLITRARLSPAVSATGTFSSYAARRSKHVNSRRGSKAGSLVCLCEGLESRRREAASKQKKNLVGEFDPGSG